MNCSVFHKVLLCSTYGGDLMWEETFLQMIKMNLIVWPDPYRITDVPINMSFEQGDRHWRGYQ